jgi:transformation/transcription domain-associated protein
MVPFRHLMSTPHRRALFDQLDKLFDEKVLLGTGLTSKENLRCGMFSVT